MEIEDDHGDGFIPISLPVLPGSVDFQHYRLLLQKIDQIMVQTGLEEEFCRVAAHRITEDAKAKLKVATKREAELEKMLGEAERANSRKEDQIEELQEELEVVSKEKRSQQKAVLKQTHHRRYASYALRCTIARFLSKKSYRDFAVQLADSILLHEFCRYNSPYAPKQTPSKSTLQRFEGWFDTEEIRRISDVVLTAAADVSSELHNDDNGLFMGIDTTAWLLDSTCMKLDIHFPVDWVLLRDSVKSIVGSIIQVRKSGLRHRIGIPESFISRINKLSMVMTNASKRSGSKKARKATFREMRKCLERVAKHGERYLGLLEERWRETDLSEAQMSQIARKLKHTLELVPAVIHQAYERIIGERKVPNEDKILSIHEEHAQVYNRGKAGAQVEFGLQLLIGENADGLIAHWELIDGTPKPDVKHVDNVLSRINELPENLKPRTLVGDRGFYSASTESKIAGADLVSNMCPKDPSQLSERMGEEVFAMFTKRRAQTEARIGILKNNFLGSKVLVHGFENQERHVAWAVLSHNLWVLGRFPFKDLLRQDAA